jgi:primosomal protein N' (replication factor Y) (superfamily II helicase)
MPRGPEGSLPRRVAWLASAGGCPQAAAADCVRDPRVAEARYARVVVDVSPAHLDRPFDYRIPEGTGALEVGRRVRVTFAGRKRVGWVIGTAEEAAAEAEKVRDLDAVDGPVTWFDEQDLELYRWVADRYAGTLADVLRHALPKRVVGEERGWPGPALPGTSTSSASSASSVSSASWASSASASTDRWAPYDAAALLAAVARTHAPRRGPAFWWRPLGGEAVVGMVMDLIVRCLGVGRSVLVLAPDPAAPLTAAAL